MIMLTRSSERIFDSMRYTGKYRYIKIDDLSCQIELTVIELKKEGKLLIVQFLKNQKEISYSVRNINEINLNTWIKISIIDDNCFSHTQRNLFEIILNQTEISLY